MAKVKEVSSYSGSAWGAAVPIGANATNIDMASNPSDYDSSTTETSTAIINTNDVKVISSDTDLTAWGKFNRFRKRVSNAFGTLSGKTLATAYTTASANSKIYSASVLNSYMTNVIGYSGTTAPSEGTVASQLSSLNSNKASITAGIRPNLLDNWYFTGTGSQSGWDNFPINQRGDTTYSNKAYGTYTIDRWYVTGSAMNVAVNGNASGQVRLTASNGSLVQFRQLVKNYNILSEKTVTLSALVTVESSGPLHFWLVNDQTYLGGCGGEAVSAGLHLLSVTTTLPNGLTNLIVAVDPRATPIRLHAMKLEIGSEQTLGIAQNGTVLLNAVPDFTDEFAKCQRYFINTGNDFKVRVAQYNSSGKNIWVGLPTPVSLALNSTPQIESFNSFRLYTPTASDSQEATRIAISNISESGVELQATYPSDTYDGFIIINNLKISADLRPNDY